MAHPLANERRPLWIAAGIAAAYLALYAFALWLNLLPMLITGVLNHIPALVGCIVAVPVLRTTAGRERAAWFAVLAVLVTWDAAEWAYSYYYLAADEWAPFPGLADVFYFAGYAALFAAIALFRREGWALRDKRAAVDASIVAVVVGAVLWQFVVLPNMYEAAGAAEVVLVAYPMLDFGAFVLLLLAFAGGAAQRRPSLLFLAAAVGIVVATDSLNVTLYSTDYMDGRYLDLGWLGGFWLMALAFLARGQEGAPAPSGLEGERTPSSWLVLAPYAATAPLMAVTALRATEGNLDPGLVVGCLGAGLLVLLRQWLTLDENRRLYGALETKTEELERHARELDRLRAAAVFAAEHDGLTGVLNRRAWFERAEAAPPAAIAIFDIDHFKTINDTRGHPTGDDVLREVAARLDRHFGEAGAVGRIGGEEFAVAIRVGGRAATALCESALAAVAEAAVVSHLEERIPVALSGGLAEVAGGIAAAYEAADAALYEAKRGGRGRLVVGGERKAA